LISHAIIGKGTRFCVTDGKSLGILQDKEHDAKFNIRRQTIPPFFLFQPINLVSSRGYISVAVSDTPVAFFHSAQKRSVGNDSGGFMRRGIMKKQAETGPPSPRVKPDAGYGCLIWISCYGFIRYWTFVL